MIGNRARKNRQQGFSLIEILIALLIGIFITMGVIQIFISSKQTYRMQEALARMQESGRFALDFLDRDIRMAGYRGCASRGSTTPISNLITNSSSYIYNYINPIQGFESSSSTWLPALPTAITSETTPSGGSDVITIRRAGDDSVMVSIADNASTPKKIKVNRDSTPSFKSCDVVLISDCSSSALLQLSDDYDPTNKEVKYTVGSGCGSSGTGGNSKALENAYAGGNLNRALATSYYIKNNNNIQPTLYRLLNANDEDELVEGVESMQIYYGIDTDNDGMANSYVKANSAIWQNVVSVRVNLLLRTIDDNITAKPLPYEFDGQQINNPPDKRMRRVFTSTIAIRNRLP